MAARLVRAASSAPAAPAGQKHLRSRRSRSSGFAAARRQGAAESLAERLGGSGDVAVVPWDRAAIASTSAHSAIVVNATSAGLDDLPLDPRALPQACTVVDLRYRPRPVDVVTAALESGHRAIDGLEMLLQQGLLSFEIWTGRNAPAGAVRTALLGAVET